jgi:hypothetical protein
MADAREEGLGTMNSLPGDHFSNLFLSNRLHQLMLPQSPRKEPPAGDSSIHEPGKDISHSNHCII